MRRGVRAPNVTSQNIIDLCVWATFAKRVRHSNMMLVRGRIPVMVCSSFVTYITAPDLHHTWICTYVSGYTSNSLNIYAWIYFPVSIQLVATDSSHTSILRPLAVDVLRALAEQPPRSHGLWRRVLDQWWKNVYRIYCWATIAYYIHLWIAITKW